MKTETSGSDRGWPTPWKACGRSWAGWESVAALEAAAARVPARGRSPRDAAARAGAAGRSAARTAAARASSSEELVLVISAAIAAFLGKKAHIRQIRLVGSGRLGPAGPGHDPGIARPIGPFGEEPALKLKITVDGKVVRGRCRGLRAGAAQPGFYPPPGPRPRPRRRAGRRAAALPRPAPPRRWPTRAKVCRSPFAGTVSRVAAQVGQTIQVNDVLLVLEAMKMETVITAPIAGKVAKINVNVGDAVQQGQVLVEFE